MGKKSRYTKKQKRGIELRKRARKKRQKAQLAKLNIPVSHPSNLMYQNHYVPKWYQKRFLQDGKHKSYYLDLSPDTITTPQGKKYTRNALLRWGPSKCFKQDNLYTFELFGRRSDVIERELFGNIDCKGSNSFDIFNGPTGWNQKKAHDKFNSFIEYMDAQKLRTPKGMSFIKLLCLTQGQQPNKNLVLGLMQQYRRMHCAMWIESIWEVVSAKDSDTKFIISDHPVIAFNHKMQPSLNVYDIKTDPPISLLGTHTVFPLNLDHCLILTHRQYALNPIDCNPLEDRINARYGDKAIFSFQDIIFERNLSVEDVTRINYIIKSLSFRYIAASEKEWLYPENSIEVNNWEKLGEVLLPPREKITLTQSIVIGHRDGSSEGVDAFGRDIPETEKEEMGKIFREVRLGKQLSKILDNDSHTDIHQKNIVLLDSIKEIFEINNDKTIDDIRKDFSEEQVKLLYNIIAELYPYKTNYYDLLPTNDNKFRGLFLGDIHPKTISRDISNIVHLFDEIFIINPFPNPNSLQKAYNPCYDPRQYLRDTYKLINSLLMIEPFIREGIVKLIPDPCEFDYSLRMKLLRMAERREKKIKFDEDDLEYSNNMAQIEFRQFYRTLPKEYLRRQIKESSKNIAEEDINKILEYVDLESKLDTTDIGKSIKETGPQLLYVRSGLNLEGTLIFCKLTGAVPITYISFKYREFNSIVNNSSGCKRWNPLIKLFDGCHILFDRIGDGCFNHFLRSEGFFEDFRNYLKKIYSTINLSSQKNQKRLKTLCEEHPKIYKQYMNEWETALKAYEGWQSYLSEEGFENMKLSSNDVFQKVKMKLVLGDLSTPSINHLSKKHFPQKRIHEFIPMAIFLDTRNIKENKDK